MNVAEASAVNTLLSAIGVGDPSRCTRDGIERAVRILQRSAYKRLMAGVTEDDVDQWLVADGPNVLMGMET